MSEEENNESQGRQSRRFSRGQDRPFLEGSIHVSETPNSSHKESSAESSGDLHHDSDVQDGGEGSAGFDSDWDEDDVQLYQELRECSEHTSITSHTSMMSISNIEDPALLRARIRKLQEQVQEWKNLYENLIDDFRNMKFSTTVEKDEEVREIKVGKKKSGHNSKDQFRKLQAELHENRTLLQLVESEKKFLLREVNKLRKERGMREVELEHVAGQMSELNRDSVLGRMVEDDLNSILTVLEEGVESGLVKFSKLRLKAQVPSFPLKDLPIGPCTCGPLLDRYKEDLEKARIELKERGEILDSMAKDFASRVAENEGTANQLRECEECLLDTNRERDEFQEKVIDCEEKIEKTSQELVDSKQNNAALKEELNQAETRCIELEDASSKALSEITSLNEEMEGLKSKEGVVEELQQQLQDVEVQLDLKQTEIGDCEDLLEKFVKDLAISDQENQELKEELKHAECRCMELEEANSKAVCDMTMLSDEVEEHRSKEGVVDELHHCLQDVEVELKLKQNEIADYEDRLDNLEKELAASGLENGELKDELHRTETRCIELEEARSKALREASSLSEEMEDLKSKDGVADELQKCLQVVELELELKQNEIVDYEERLDKVVRELAVSDLENGGLKKELNQAETRCIQLEAARSKTLCDITSLSEEVQILKSKDGTSGELQKRLRIIEVELNRKQHEIVDCEDRIASLVRELATSDVEKGELKEEIAKCEDRLDCLVKELNASYHENELLKDEVCHVSASEENLANLGASSLSLTVNVDINSLQPSSATTTLSTAANTVGVASATVPLRFESNYRRTMENAMLAVPDPEENHYGGSETESEAAYLDKDYWVQRAGELSLQLQQSSAYWTTKVRELSLELEKERQFHRDVEDQQRFLTGGSSVDQPPPMLERNERTTSTV